MLSNGLLSSDRKVVQILLVALTLFVVFVSSLSCLDNHTENHHHPDSKYVYDVTERNGNSVANDNSHDDHHDHYHGHHHHGHGHNHHHHHHDGNHHHIEKRDTGAANIISLRRHVRNSDKQFGKARSKNHYASDRKSTGRKFNSSWVQSEDNLSPEYSWLKRVACKLEKLEAMQIAMIEGLILTAHLPPSQNPVIRCNKERQRSKKPGDVDLGIKGANDFNLQNLHNLCKYPDKWVAFEHCVLGKLRNNDDYVLYQETMKKARLILDPMSMFKKQQQQEPTLQEQTTNDK